MFGRAAEQTFTFECPAHTEALNRLLYVAEQGEAFVSLTAKPGTGRSRLLRRLQEECIRGGQSAILCNVAALDENAFLWHICGGLSIAPNGQQSRSSLMSAVRDEIVGRALCHHQTIIILDDLHRAAEDLSGAVQFLSAINEQTQGGITTVVGTDDSPTTRLVSLSSLRVQLGPLCDEDSERFAQEYLQAANADVGRIQDSGWQAIKTFAIGYMSRLTRLCEIAAVALSTSSDLQLDAAAISLLSGETLLRQAG